MKIPHIPDMSPYLDYLVMVDVKQKLFGEVTGLMPEEDEFCSGQMEYMLGQYLKFRLEVIEGT